VADAPIRKFLNEIPISLALSAEQVDRLIAAGRELLRSNANFGRLVASLDGQLSAAPAAAVAPPAARLSRRGLAATLQKLRRSPTIKPRPGKGASGRTVPMVAAL